MTIPSKVKLLVLGAKGVGKSAVVVRFLTKRYIGEYQSNIDILYKKNYRCDDLSVNLEILDLSSKQEISNGDLEEHILWANGFVVLYDISDRNSLLEAQQYLEAISLTRGLLRLPCILLANKKDMEIARQVPISNGRDLAVKFSCQFFEISAADSHIGVTVSFDAVIREIHSQRRIRGSPQSATSNQAHKKLGIVAVSRVFGAVFGKSNSDGDFFYSDIDPFGNCCNDRKSKRSANILGTKSFCKAKKSKSATMIRVTRKQSQPLLSV